MSERGYWVEKRDFEPTLGGTVEKWVLESGPEKGSLG